MATSKDYLRFILDELSGLENVSYRSMMGEYIIYYNDKIAAYLCDDRLFVKITPVTEKLLPNAPRESPYDGAKDMLLIEDVDDRVFLETLFCAMEPDLSTPKTKLKTKKRGV